MEKFKYEQYDYTKIINKNVHFRYVYPKEHFELIKSIFHCDGYDTANRIVETLKEQYVAGKNYEAKENRYTIDDFNFEWEIITHEGTYKSNETSSKEK